MDSAPGPLPRFWEYDCPPHWRQVDFISDLHLCESAPSTWRALQRYLSQTAADAVFILGDLFEVWVGDDALSGEFESQVAQGLDDATERLTLAIMVGNRDFLLGAEFIRRSNALALPDPTVLKLWDERLLLSHGDALCTHDTDYLRFREQVRGQPWQQDFLAKPLGARRAMAQAMRQESQRRQRDSGPQGHSDVDAATASRWMHEAACPHLVHGHTHRPQDEAVSPNQQRHVLSDWDLEPSHADGWGELRPRAEVLSWWPHGWGRNSWV
jgi:UDP-2,3-diacylglucosamine hydrolase